MKKGAIKYNTQVTYVDGDADKRKERLNKKLLDIINLEINCQYYKNN